MTALSPISRFDAASIFKNLQVKPSVRGTAFHEFNIVDDKIPNTLNDLLKAHGDEERGTKTLSQYLTAIYKKLIRARQKMTKDIVADLRLDKKTYDAISDKIEEIKILYIYRIILTIRETEPFGKAYAEYFEECLLPPFMNKARMNDRGEKDIETDVLRIALLKKQEVVTAKKLLDMYSGNLSKQAVDTFNEELSAEHTKRVNAGITEDKFVIMIPYSKVKTSHDNAVAVLVKMKEDFAMGLNGITADKISKKEDMVQRKIEELDEITKKCDELRIDYEKKNKDAQQASVAFMKYNKVLLRNITIEQELTEMTKIFDELPVIEPVKNDEFVPAVGFKADVEFVPLLTLTEPEFPDTSGSNPLADVVVNTALHYLIPPEISIDEPSDDGLKRSDSQSSVGSHTTAASETTDNSSHRDDFTDISSSQGTIDYLSSQEDSPILDNELNVNADEGAETSMLQPESDEAAEAARVKAEADKVAEAARVKVEADRVAEAARVKVEADKVADADKAAEAARVKAESDKVAEAARVKAESDKVLDSSVPAKDKTIDDSNGYASEIEKLKQEELKPGFDIYSYTRDKIGRTYLFNKEEDRIRHLYATKKYIQLFEYIKEISKKSDTQIVNEIHEDDIEDLEDNKAVHQYVEDFIKLKLTRDEKTKITKLHTHGKYPEIVDFMYTLKNKPYQTKQTPLSTSAPVAKTDAELEDAFSKLTDKQIINYFETNIRKLTITEKGKIKSYKEEDDNAGLSRYFRLILKRGGQMTRRKKKTLRKRPTNRKRKTLRK
jgi:hypothetical protein